MIRNNQPKPHYACFVCLRKVGYGYDRTARHFGVSKARVYAWFKHHAIITERPQTSYIDIGKTARLRLTAPKPTKPKIDWVTRLVASRRRKKLKIKLQSRVWQFFVKGFYPNWCARLVGCSRSEFVLHIHSQLKTGMTPENYGKYWELDHIIPCAHFNLEDETQRLTAFHFSNYQPLTKHENRVKHTKIYPVNKEG